MPAVKAYRYEDRTYAPPLDEWDMPCGSARQDIALLTFTVVKETPKGFWISYYSSFSNKKFVRNEARKKFAHLTIEDAQTSYLARKQAQLGIFQTRLASTESFIRLAIERGFAHVSS